MSYITDESCLDPAGRDSGLSRNSNTFHQDLSVSIKNVCKFNGTIPSHFTK